MHRTIHLQSRPWSAAGALLAALGLTLVPAAGGKGKAAAPSSAGLASPGTTAAASRFGSLPLHFEPNVGQADSSVQFVSRGQGYRLLLTGSEAVITLNQRRKPRPGGPLGPDRTAGAAGATLRMRLDGARDSLTARGDGRLPGVSNYFLGNRPAAWRTGVPHFAKVRYDDVYAGVDLVYYGKQGKLEYDFIVARGADPGRIRMAFDGARGVRVDDDGALVLDVPGGEIRQHAPVVYQEDAGRRVPVSSRYALLASASTAVVGFALGDYDPSRPLVIDPVLEYSTYLGGSAFDEAVDVAVDGNRNVYVYGATESTDFPVANPFRGHHSGNVDLFLTKLDPTGTQVLYSTYIGGSGQDDVLQNGGLRVDGQGQAYLTGLTDSSDFPVWAPYQATRAGGWDMFLVRLSGGGNFLLNSTYFGGTGHDVGCDVAVDNNAFARVIGYTESTDFPVHNAFQSGSGGGLDAFVACLFLSTQTMALEFSTYLGGSGEDRGIAIDLDSQGEAYLAGSTTSPNFPGPGGVTPVSVGRLSVTTAPHQGGGMDGFVVKLLGNGMTVEYSRYLGGTGKDEALGIVVDPARHAYIVGTTDSDDFPKQAPLQLNRAGGSDAFVTSLDPAGTTVRFSTYLGGSQHDGANGVALEMDNAFHVGGWTESPDFPALGALQAFAGVRDGFVSTFAPNGGSLQFSTFFGGSDEEHVNGIAADRAGGIYVAGDTRSSGFPTVRPVLPTLGGPVDAFVAKISRVPNPPTSLVATAVSQSVVRLQWVDNGLDEQRYEIERRSLGGQYALVGVVGPDSTTFEDQGLATHSRYFYRVRAVNSFGPSPFSNEAPADTFPDPPNAPGNLSVTAQSTTTLRLSWTDASNNEHGFQIERSPDGINFTEIDHVNTDVTTYEDRTLAPDTTAHYRVRAHNRGGGSPYSNTATGTTFPLPPQPPTGLDVHTVSETELELRWRDNSTNEDGFEIERSTDQGGTFAPLARARANENAFLDTQLTPNTRYDYRVRAVNRGNTSDYSNVAFNRTAEIPGRAPTGLTLTVLSQTAIRLDWVDNSANEDGFRIERRRRTTEFGVVGTAPPNATTFTNTDLLPYTEYIFRVRAFNSAGVSPASQEAIASTLPNPPAAPTGLEVLAISQSQLQVSWIDNSPDESGFELERRVGDGDFSLLQRVGVNTTSVTDTGLEPGRVYTYRVRSVNAGGASPYTDPVSGRTDASPPARPINLTVQVVSSTELRLLWSDESADEAGFRIERAGGTPFQQVETVGPNVNTFTDSGLTGNTTYRYRVRAFNSGGNSGYSNEARGTTLPPAPAAPTDLTVVTLSDQLLSLTWTDNSNNEARFEVERRSGGSDFVQVGIVNTDVTTYFDTGLTANTSYTYRVRAVNAGAASAYSNEASGTTRATAAAGSLSVRPGILKFAGARRVTTKNVTLKNTGRGPLRVSVGDLLAPFEVVRGGGVFTLKAGATRQVGVRYRPGRTGTRSVRASLSIGSSDAVKPVVNVSVIGSGK